MKNYLVDAKLIKILSEEEAEEFRKTGTPFHMGNEDGEIKGFVIGDNILVEEMKVNDERT